MFRSSSPWLALLIAAPAQAQWSGEISLGYLATSGNTSTESLNGKLLLEYEAATWKNSFQVLGVYTDDQGETSAERYAASDKVDWKIGARNYVFAAVDWEKDLFSGIRERTSETVGYGRHLLTGPVHVLDLEAGAGARQTRENFTGQTEDDMIFRGLGKYEWKFSPTSQFGQSLKVESGASNTFGESLSELKLSIIGNLFATISYTVKHNTDVPSGTERTDTFSAVNLSYVFGKK